MTYAEGDNVRVISSGNVYRLIRRCPSRDLPNSLAWSATQGSDEDRIIIRERRFVLAETSPAGHRER